MTALKVLRKLLYFLVALLVCSFLLMNCTVNLSPSDAEVREKYAHMPLKVKRDSLGAQSYRYYEVSLDHKPVAVLLVHGAPGSADMWEEFFADSMLLSRADVLVVDRLGYGGSEYGDAEVSIHNQAAQLHDLLTQFQGRKIIAVGHSYGGPIIAQLAAEYPEDVDMIMMLAPALDPDAEKFESLAKVAQWRLTRWMFPKLIRVSAEEKRTHRDQLKMLQPLLSQITVPTIHVHGDGDWIVPFQNLKYAVAEFDAQILDTMFLPGGNHFLIEGSQAEKVKKRLFNEIDRLAKITER